MNHCARVGGVGAGEAALRVSAAACFAGPLGRACEPQAGGSGISGSEADDPVEMWKGGFVSAVSQA